MAALQGDQARVRGNFASELGKGAALFASGRLSAFNLRVVSSYADVVADMEKRFGAPGQKVTVSRVGWPTPIQEFRWERDGVLAAVWNNEFSDGTVVIVGFLESPYESFLRGTVDKPGQGSIGSIRCQPEAHRTIAGFLYSPIESELRPTRPNCRSNWTLRKIWTT